MAEEKLRELPGTDSIHLLRRVLLQEVTDVTIVSLDFGYIPHEENKVTQIGISTFSTNKWRQLSLAVDASAIRSRCIRTPIKSLITSNFIFGEFETIYRRNLVDFLRETWAQKSPDGTTQRVVLYSFALEGVLDLNTITKTLELPFKTRPSLTRILKYLEIPFQEEYLHDAGNDAHLTLRGLLMLAAIAFRRMEVDEVVRGRIKSLKTIALDSIEFDLVTPDEMKRRQRDEDARKAAELRAKQGQVIKSDGDWLGADDEEACLGGSCLDSRTSSKHSI
ncbi:hypothetical protein DL98DRAFT_530605 [Cadophora sp. DSE1049]|nr:hypothetical protein DL98DRAFT_530605 [Cadophora sp. DSE1049]